MLDVESFERFDNIDFDNRVCKDRSDVGVEVY